MADQFHTGVCGENWWNSSKPMFGSSPCSSLINDIGGFAWQSDLLDMKSRSSDESGSASNGSMVFQDIQKPCQPDLAGGGGNISVDSTLQIMGIGLSPYTTTDWNQALIGGSGRGENNYQPMLQEDLNSSLNYGQETEVDCSQIQNKDWSPKNQDFSLDQQPLHSLTNSGEFTATCEGLATSFPMSSSSYCYPSTSTLMQTLFDSDSPPQQSPFNNPSMNFCPSTINLNEISPSLPKFSSLMKPSLPKPAPFWNASTAALNDIRAGFFPSSQSQFLSSTFEEKPNCPKLISKSNNEEVRDSSSMVKKSSSEPVFKRTRIETPSPLPTFKVRKEKLGDRITALQQLVSPFGKTDTASVLHEAIDYIRLLHGQVNVLSTPYMKSGAPIQCQQTPDKLKQTEEPKQDLRSRGLCLVPISSTFPVAAETTADFWTPTFGGTFR